LRRAATGSCPIGRSARGGTKLNVVSTVSPTMVLLQSAFFVVALVISTLQKRSAQRMMHTHL
jgi:hypothetical protein